MLHFLQSGVLVIPLSREAATQGSKQFEVKHTLSSIFNSFFALQTPQKRRTKKFYLALLRGHVEEDRVDIDIPIGETARP